MSRETTLIVLSFLLILSPFVGLPYTWLMVVVPLLSMVVLGLSIVLRIHRLQNTNVPVAPVITTNETSSVV